MSQSEQGNAGLKDFADQVAKLFKLGNYRGLRVIKKPSLIRECQKEDVWFAADNKTSQSPTLKHCYAIKFFFTITACLHRTSIKPDFKKAKGFVRGTLYNIVCIFLY